VSLQRDIADLISALEVFVAEGRPHSYACDCAQCHLWQNCKKLLEDYKRDLPPRS